MTRPALQVQFIDLFRVLDLWQTAEKLLVELQELGWGSADQQISNVTTGVW